VSNWNTAGFIDVNNMFSNCGALTTLDVSGWDTTKVTNMESMFNACPALKELDLCNWNTKAVTNTKSMFANSSKLKTIYVGDDWDMSKVTKSTEMFTGCFSLKGAKDTTISDAFLDKTYARVDNAPEEPGYFTYKGNASP
jgi:surface protein